MAPLIKIATFLSLSLYAAAQGTQFITGACTSDADCASACCGFNSGKCAGPVIAQERDGGCGFGNATPNNQAALAAGSTEAAPGVPAAGAGAGTGSAATASVAAAPAAATSSAATASTGSGSGATGAGNGQGTQFITGPCTSDADCAAGCCGFNSGKCAGAVVAQERDGGCGFGDAQPNDNAAKALTGAGRRLGKRDVSAWALAWEI